MARGKSRRCAGFFSSDGRFAHCSREEHSGSLPIEDGSTYAHLLEGACKCGREHNPPPLDEDEPQEHPTVVCTYQYRDADNALVYEVLRRSDKTFIQRRPDPNGGWIWNLADTPRLLFRLPELLAADPCATVFICEGEKDVENLRALGLVATCNSGGTGQGWPHAQSHHLAGRHVVILPDNDEPGRKHATKVSESVSKHASVSILDLPGLHAGGGDVSDWLAQGGTKDHLIGLVAPPSNLTTTTADLVARIKANPPEYMKPDVLAFVAGLEPHECESFLFQIRGIKGVSTKRFQEELRKTKPAPRRKRTDDDTATEDPDFVVVSVTLTSTLPRIYTLTLEGGVLRLDTATLLMKSKFKQAFVEQMNRIPALPKKWEDLVNAWLSNAQYVELAPEASEDVMIRRDVIDHVSSLGTSDKLMDIDHGRGFVTLEKRLSFRLKPLLHTLRSDGYPKLTSRDLIDHLKALGCESKVHRVESICRRLWDAPEVWPDLLEENGSAAPPPERNPGEDEDDPPTQTSLL